MARAGIALGTNLGDRLTNLRAALSCLHIIATHGEPVLTACIYQTAPCGCPPDSPDFFNTVVEIDYTGDAPALLMQTQRIEQILGRVPAAERNAPRLIDLDLLYLGDECLNNGDLVLPHPRIHERRFVLQPLADIRPELLLPGRDLTVLEMLHRLDSSDAPLVMAAMSTGADGWALTK